MATSRTGRSSPGTRRGGRPATGSDTAGQRGLDDRGGDGGRDRPPPGGPPPDPDDARSGHPLLRPIWLVAHVVVLGVLVGFPLLGSWQWERYREETATAARIEQQLGSEPVPLTSVLTPEVDGDRAAALEFTPVEVTGTWAGDEQVAQRSSHAGQGGFDLLTPLELGDGTAVLVRRGFVPPDGPASADPTVDDPVDGEVTVTGFLEVGGEQPDGIGARDPATGVLSTVFHADVERLDRQTDADLLPMVVHLTAQQPDDGRLPLPQPPPEHDASQNLSYAFQWYAFAAIVGIGYVVVLRRRVLDHRRGIDTDVDPLLRDRDGTGP